MFCGLKSFVGAAVFSQLDVNIRVLDNFFKKKAGSTGNRAEFDDRLVIYLASIAH